MPTKCCIPTCKNNNWSRSTVGLDVEHIKYHRFPYKDEQQLRKWCDFVGQDYVPCKSHRICSLHFDPSCYYRYLNTIIALKKDAVPTIIGQFGSNLNMPQNSNAEDGYYEEQCSDTSRDTMYKENQIRRNARRSTAGGLTEREILLRRMKWRMYSRKARKKKNGLLDSPPPTPEPFDCVVSMTSQGTMSIDHLDSIDIKYEMDFNMETKEDFLNGGTCRTEFVNLHDTVKTGMEADTDIEREVIEPLLDIKQETEDDTETEQDVAVGSIVSAEFVDVHVAIKKEVETYIDRDILEPEINIKHVTEGDTETLQDVAVDSTFGAEFVDAHVDIQETYIDRVIFEPEINIKQETEDDTETEQVIKVGSTFGAEFVDVGDKVAPPVAAHGVFDPLPNVEILKEEYSSSLLNPKSSDSDPLWEEVPAQDRSDLGANLPSYVAKDNVLPCESILVNPLTSQPEKRSAAGGFTCDTCAKTFKTRQQVITHLKTHSLVKPYACNVCSLAFASRGYLTKHSQTHSRKWSFTCSDCDKSFRCSALLVAHMFVHNGKKGYACGECGRSFAGKYNLTKHVRRRHKAKETSSQTVEKVFVCEHCGKCSSTESALNQHMTTHTRVRSFRCEFCPKSFASKKYLKNHVMLHTGERLFECETCNRCFISRCDLKKHERSHTGEKPFECTLCGMCFSFRHNLKTHLARHSGAKPFACSVCDRRFADKHNQIRHEKNHAKQILKLEQKDSSS